MKLSVLRALVRSALVTEAATLDDAVMLATELHKDQQDKGGEAYIEHPLRVMRSIKARGYDDAVAIAAVLHDTVEDTPLTVDDIAQRFGPHVAKTVGLLTKRAGDTYERFIDRIIDAGDVDAMRVKLADLEDNMDIKRLGRDPNDRDMKRLTRYQRAHERLTDALKGI